MVKEIVVLYIVEIISGGWEKDSEKFFDESGLEKDEDSMTENERYFSDDLKNPEDLIYSQEEFIDWEVLPEELIDSFTQESFDERVTGYSARTPDACLGDDKIKQLRERQQSHNKNQDKELD